MSGVPIVCLGDAAAVRVCQNALTVDGTGEAVECGRGITLVHVGITAPLTSPVTFVFGGDATPFLCAAQVALVIVNGASKDLVLNDRLKYFSLLSFSAGAKSILFLVTPSQEMGVDGLAYDSFSVEMLRHTRLVGFPSDRAFVARLPDFVMSYNVIEELSGPIRAAEAATRGVRVPLRVVLPLGAIPDDSGVCTGLALVLASDLRSGQELVVNPSGAQVSVSAIGLGSGKFNIDRLVGPAVTLLSLKCDGVNPHSLENCTLLGKIEADKATKVVSAFEAQIIVMKTDPRGDNIVTADDVLTVNMCGRVIKCRVGFILSQMNRRTGLVEEMNPVKLKAGDAGTVVLHPLDPVLCDKFSDCSATGRFTATVPDQTVVMCVGVIKSIELIAAELLKAPAGMVGGSGAPSAAASTAGSEPDVVASDSEEPSPKLDTVEPSIAVITAIAAATSEAELCHLFEELLAACGRDGRGVCGVSSAAVPTLRAAKPAIMSAAIERREEAASVWSPEVAKVFGAFLKAIL